MDFNGAFTLVISVTTSLLEEPEVVKISKKYNKTPAQVLLRQAIQRGIVVLFKSVNEERVKSNSEVKSLI